ncbi:MarR family winged helix-turn-helix transcriptional regulator [Brachybacterium phenoliresistens]|uniref:MarR family winged helix-turn-helix transcriptional regulator n=1 Tax=Brachybacterium phenoliresistens TaxID=396014 RepID=UPI0004B018EE|nr:MarR family transcriptional regulator [Brachybacterium phenoliresistens]
MADLPAEPHPSSGYWFPPDEPETASTVELLNELRRYRSSNTRMRSRVGDDMDMGEKDLLALRALLEAQAEGRVLRQRDLARMLDIRPASASALVDRLVRDGHAERMPHPEDRRSIAVVPTRHGDEEVRATLADMHERMFAVARALSPEEREVVTGFLRRLNHDAAGEGER